MNNLDIIVDRDNSSSVKYEEMSLKFGRNDLLPFWVADMDLKCPDFMIETLVRRAEHGVFGYTKRMPDFYKSIVNWLKDRHNLIVEGDVIEYGPGVVFQLSTMIRLFTSENDKIIIQSPVYYPFKNIVEGHKRIVSDNTLKEANGKYAIDFEDLEKRAKDPDCTMMLFCSPHNPVGRVWRLEELERICEICYQNDVLILSDEIHYDLVYKGNKHTPLLGIDDKYKNNIIMCTAPSKTFNIAGLHSSYCVIYDEEKLKAYRTELGLMDLNRSNSFSREITQAVFEQGASYVDELVEFLEANMNFAYDFISERIEGLIPMKMEATYLMWIDCRELGISSDEIDSLFINEAGIALDSGYWFGPSGEGFMRLNFACSRKMLKAGLEKLEKAVRNLSCT